VLAGAGGGGGRAEDRACQHADWMRGRGGSGGAAVGAGRVRVAWTRWISAGVRLRFAGRKSKSRAHLRRESRSRCGRVAGRRLSTGQKADPDLRKRVGRQKWPSDGHMTPNTDRPTSPPPNRRVSPLQSPASSREVPLRDPDEQAVDDRQRRDPARHRARAERRLPDRRREYVVCYARESGVREVRDRDRRRAVVPRLGEGVHRVAGCLPCARCRSPGRRGRAGLPRSGRRGRPARRSRGGRCGGVSVEVHGHQGARADAVEVDGGRGHDGVDRSFEGAEVQVATVSSTARLSA